MALIKYGPTVVGVRGTVGGITFSANLASPYIKSWAKPVNRRSTPQSTARGSFGGFAASWVGLTQAQRDGWDTYAAAAAQDLTNSLGETYSASGFNWYIKINTQLALAGRAARVAAPTATRPAAPNVTAQILATTASVKVTSVRVDPLDPDFGADAAVLSTYFMTQGRGFANKARQWLSTEQPAGAGLVNLNAEVIGKYGNIELGSRIFYFVHYQDLEGQRGPATEVSTDAEL